MRTILEHYGQSATAMSYEQQSIRLLLRLRVHGPLLQVINWKVLNKYGYSQVDIKLLRWQLPLLSPHNHQVTKLCEKACLSLIPIPTDENRFSHIK